MHDLKVVGRWSAVVGGLVRVESFLRVLVVDDSSLYRHMLMRALAEVDGVEVIDVACDGVEALEKIERLQPDLVTLDVQMPKLDGLGVLREVSRRSLKTTILLNASTAFWIQGKCSSLGEGMELAESLIVDGVVKNWLEKASNFFK